MTFGAFFWGTFSDSRGRKIPYTMTLAITSIFGLLSSFTFNFWSLCLTLFFLGFGVGGNMPTDGKVSLTYDHPSYSQCLSGALYLEFLPKEYHYLLTLMSVFFSFGAVFASVIGYLILPKWSCPEFSTEPCDMHTQNNGWRIMLFSVSIVTIMMLALRTLWLRLPETPKFLMSQARHNETIIVLQDIAKINGGHVHIDKDELSPSLRITNEFDNRVSIEEDDNRVLLSTGQHGVEQIITEKRESTKALKILLSPHWRLSTILIWIIWTFTSVAYTMFNVFLPKYLETLGFEGESVPTYKEVYWDYMIYSLAGVPGSVVMFVFKKSEYIHIT